MSCICCIFRRRHPVSPPSESSTANLTQTSPLPENDPASFQSADQHQESLGRGLWLLNNAVARARPGDSGIRLSPKEEMETAAALLHSVTAVLELGCSSDSSADQAINPRQSTDNSSGYENVPPVSTKNFDDTVIQLIDTVDSFVSKIQGMRRASQSTGQFGRTVKLIANRLVPFLKVALDFGKDVADVCHS
jgi:hypothetical protein